MKFGQLTKYKKITKNIFGSWESDSNWIKFFHFNILKYLQTEINWSLNTAKHIKTMASKYKEWVALKGMHNS